MDRYTSMGKEVLFDGMHFGDTNSPEDAARVAEAMNLMDRIIDDGK